MKSKIPTIYYALREKLIEKLKLKKVRFWDDIQGGSPCPIHSIRGFLVISDEPVTSLDNLFESANSGKNASLPLSKAYMVRPFEKDKSGNHQYSYYLGLDMIS